MIEFFKTLWNKSATDKVFLIVGATILAVAIGGLVYIAIVGGNRV